MLQCKSNIIYDVFIADSFITRLSGYMLRVKPHYNAIIIKPCNSIHTFFMKFNLDILFLDKDMNVIKKFENVKCGKFILPVKNATSVVEAKAGKFTEIIEGDKIIII